METICDLVNTASNGEINISIDEKKSLEEPNQESNLKLKRCKHGRIIIKDLSKKKPVQLGDIETNQLQSKNLDTNETLRQSRTRKNDNFSSQGLEEVSSANLRTLTSNAVCNDSLPNEFEVNQESDKARTCKEKSPDGISSSRKGRSRTPMRRRSRIRSRTPSRRRRRVSRSPSHRKSPRREKGRRHQSRSPRRRDRSRSPRVNKTGSQRITSSNKRQYRSPKRDRNSPISYRGNRQSSRIESSRRRLSQSRSKSRSKSRSRSRSKSACRIGISTNNSHPEGMRSPQIDLSGRRDRFTRDSAQDRVSRRKEIFDKSPKELNHYQSKEALNTNKLNNLASSQLLPETHLPNQASISQQEELKVPSHHLFNPTQPEDLKYSPKTAQLDASPNKSLSARSSMTFSTDNSASSDIYDPEGPIITISPGDSPPLSPVNKAANNKITYRLDGERNDDDVPSSAVQLNHQEKYLQKLNRQERVVEEVKIALKPHYQKRAINKEQYKDVLRRAVPKICHSKNGEINPVKIRTLVDAYVIKMKRRK